MRTILLMLTLALLFGWIGSEPDGVCPDAAVGGAVVGGLPTLAETRSALENYFNRARTITIQAGDRSLPVKTDTIGVRVDTAGAAAQAWLIGREVSPLERIEGKFQRLWSAPPAIPPGVIVDRPADPNALFSSLDHDPQPPQAAAEPDGSFRLTGAQPGQKVDRALAPAFLDAAITSLADTVELPVVHYGPTPALGSDTVARPVAEISHDYSNKSAAVIHNIARACALLNGHVLMPGETFSFNAAVGPATRDNGFEVAPGFQDARVVDLEGGGVCACSSLLFEVAMQANAKILSRAGHSRPSTTAPPGLDATVAWPAPDLKFANQLSGPMIVGARMEGSRARIWLASTATPPAGIRIWTTSRPGERGHLLVQTWRQVPGADPELIGAATYALVRGR